MEVNDEDVKENGDSHLCLDGELEVVRMKLSEWIHRVVLLMHFCI